ncbi:MAG: hypothetical protein JRN09_05060 [Nitrososphaerota archaeon]|nr:hypothetical protein [Nitrososphaerota archaeon]
MKSVWRILSDASYAPKLYRDAIGISLDPPGPVAVGQKCTIYGSVGGMKVDSTIEYTRVEKERALASRAVPGGMLSVFDQEFILVPGAWNTMVRITISYEVAPGFASKMPDTKMMSTSLLESFRSFSRNLKELSELMPLSD